MHYTIRIEVSLLNFESVSLEQAIDLSKALLGQLLESRITLKEREKGPWAFRMMSVVEKP